jgi:hypothetical protein
MRFTTEVTWLVESHPKIDATTIAIVAIKIQAFSNSVQSAQNLYFRIFAKYSVIAFLMLAS